MKDHIHNLIQQISEKQDSVWRYENHYIKDAEAAGCDVCVAMYKKHWEADNKDVEELTAELKKHLNEG